MSGEWTDLTELMRHYVKRQDAATARFVDRFKWHPRLAPKVKPIEEARERLAKEKLASAREKAKKLKAKRRKSKRPSGRSAGRSR